MSRQSGLRGALESGDIDLLWRMWDTWFPAAPQPETRAEAEVQFHAARTASASVSLRLRSHSHFWLLDKGLPSMLPDDLRPKAERHRPTRVAGVGFSWDATSHILKPAKDIVMRAVGDRIEDMAADGLLETDPDRVQREMMHTKNRTLLGLFGNFDPLRKAPA